MATFNHSRPRQMPKNSNRSIDQSLSIYVGNLSYNTTEQSLGSFFDQACGQVKTVRIIYDHETRESRGFGFVQFHTGDAFNAALKLNETQLDGRSLKISPSDAKSTSSSSPATATTATTTPSDKLKTRVVHCKKSKYDVYIGRPSDWGNPFVIGKDGDRADVIQKYRAWIVRQPNLLARAKQELQGRTIACWCAPEACHGDVLAEIADAN